MKRTVNCIAVAPLMLASTAMLSCGARTELELEHVPMAADPAGAFMVEATGQCGLCFRQPFSVSRRLVSMSSIGTVPFRQSVCSSALGCDPFARKAGNPLGTELAQPVVVPDPNTGNPTTIYCALNSVYHSDGTDQLREPEDPTTAFMPMGAGHIDICNLAPDAIRQFHAVLGRADCQDFPVGTLATVSVSNPCFHWTASGSVPESTQAEFCHTGGSAFRVTASGRYQCNRPVTTDTTPPCGEQLGSTGCTTPWPRANTLADFYCEKPPLVANPAICVSGANNAARLQEGGRMLQVLRSAITRRAPGALPPDAPERDFLLEQVNYCFVQAASVHHRTQTPPSTGIPELERCLVPSPPAAGLPPERDPGVIPHGQRYTATTATTLTFSKSGGGSVVLNLSGSAAGYAAPSGGFYLSELKLFQTTAVSFEGHAISAASASASSIWTGTHTPATGALSLSANDANLFFEYSDNGHHYGQTLRATSASPGTRTASGISFVMTFVDDGSVSGIAGTYTLNVVLSESTPRPAAVISSVINEATGGAVTQESAQECETVPGAGPGIRLAVTAVTSPATGQWFLNGSGLGIMQTEQFVAGGVNHLFVPFTTQGNGFRELTLQTYSNLLMASDARGFLVRDTTAPTYATPSFVFGCGADRPRDIFGTLCALHAQGTAAPALDSCDESPTTTAETVTVYNGLGTVVQTVQCDSPAYPLATTDTNARYRVRWRARDASGNVSNTFITQLRVDSELGSTACTGSPHYRGVVEYNGLESTAPTLPIEALQDLDFSSQPAGAYAFLSPFEFSRASQATVQVSASSVVTSGIGANIARIGNDGASHLGLVFEETRTNFIPASRNQSATGWNVGYLSSNVAALFEGPDGSLLATEVLVSPSGYSKYVSLGSRAGMYTASNWYAHPTASGIFQLFNEEVPWIGSATWGATALNWRRSDVAHLYPAAGTTSYFVPLDGRDLHTMGGTTAQAITARLDLAQFEQGAFPTEAIVTTSAPSTRAADTLSVAATSALLDGGRLNLELRLTPKGARSENPSWLDIWSQGTNYISVNAPTGNLHVYVNGISQVYSGIDWNRGEVLDLYVGVGGNAATIVGWRRSNGAAVRFDGMSIAAIAGAQASSLLCTGTAYTFTAWVQQLRLRKSSILPQWIPSS